MPNDRIIKVELEDYILYDKLNTVAIEYATSVDFLVNAAAKRLVNDIAFVQELRKGRLTSAPRQDGQT